MESIAHIQVQTCLSPSVATKKNNSKFHATVQINCVHSLYNIGSTMGAHDGIIYTILDTTLQLYTMCAHTTRVQGEIVQNAWVFVYTRFVVEHVRYARSTACTCACTRVDRQIRAK